MIDRNHEASNVPAPDGKRVLVLACAVAVLLGGCGGGSSNDSGSNPVPVVNLTVAPASVSIGGSATLTWRTVDATGCAAGGGWSGPKDVSGSESTPALTQSTVFSLNCTGPGGAASASVTVAVTSRLLSGVVLPGFPHEIDVYRAVGARRAIVFLHGGGGRNYQFANELGIINVPTPPTNTDVDWPWLEANQVLAVFPQGQRQTIERQGFTWNNHVMQSGQDDVAFLRALVTYIGSEYGITRVAVVGHSNGGMMANRMWCESPDTFEAYVSIAGPASAYYLDASTQCLPAREMPYYGLVGELDNVLQVTGNWDAETWAINPVLVTADFVNPSLIGEWQGHRARSSMLCGEAPTLGDATSNGIVSTWSNCGGNIVLERVSRAGHLIDSLEATYGTAIKDLAIRFIDGL